MSTGGDALSTYPLHGLLIKSLWDRNTTKKWFVSTHHPSCIAHVWCWFSSCWLLSTQHPSKYLSPLSYPSTSKVKTNILGSVIFFWANFQHLATKKSGKFWKFSLLKCKLDQKKSLVLFEKSQNFGIHKTEKEKIGGK